MAKWLKRIGIFLGIVVLLLAVALWWLLGSASGLRFALARAQAFTDGALTVQQADGHLAGPLQLKGLRYADGQGMEVKVASATLDLRLWPLLRKRAHVLNLDADGIDVALPKSKEEEKPSETSFSLKPPLDIVLDRVHVGAVRIAQAGEPLFASNRLDLAGQWTSAGIELHQLNLLAPDGHADLNGKLVIAAGEQGDGAAGFAWKVAGVEYAGSIEAHGDGKRIKTELKLTQPTALQLTVDAAQRGDYDWNARLDAPRFDPKPLLGDSSLTALGLALQGSGDRHGGTLQGKVDLNDYQLLLQPLSARFSDDFKTLQLQKLTLGSPQIKGQLEANGTVQLGAQPVSGDLTIAWKDLLLPASLAGQDLASQGSLKARGSADAFHAEGDVDIGPPGKLAKLALNLDGTPKLITLHTLELKQPQGGMQAKGTLTLQPALAWQLEATANKLDPGQLLAGWNGALDFDIATDGTLPQNQPDATLDIRKLAGTLRDRPVRAQGKLHLTPQQVVDGKLDLASGGSTVKLDAKPGASNDAQLDLAIASLGDWLPDAQGRVQGDLRLRGKAPKFSLDAKLQGNGIAYAGQTIDSLHLNANLPDLSNPGGQLDLETGAAKLGGLDFKRIDLHGEGSSARHSLTLQASGQQLSTRVALSGGMKGSAWNGTLSTLDLEPQGIPRWHLQQPAQLGYDNGAMSLSELCLTAGEPQLCVAAKQDKAGNLDANYRLRDLPLALLMTFAGPDMPMRADGTLGGSGSIRRNAAGALSGSASITSPRGTITYVDRADQPLLSYNELALQAQLSPSSQNATLHAGLNDGGRVDGQVSINGAQQALGGQLELHLNNLKFIELFSNEVAEVKGAANGSFRFAGTVAQPLVSGQAAVTGFAAEVPSAGLKLSQGQLTVSTTDARQFLIGGSVQSGKGSLRIDGHAGVGEGATTAINVKGSQFTAADIPSAKVIISPDLQITQDAKGINVGGDVTLDTADIDVSRLPGAGATQASPDVVVVDQEQQAEKAKALPITASVKVDLGRKTHLVGFGLDGRLSGTLTVSERPGRATTGQGQITVDGIYKAYGQNLQIEQGRLLFASTPVDNPGLDIRAARKLNPNATIDEGQKVGLMVSGTAQRPVLTVFSNPVMEQSDALSYLITGKPLSQVKGGEGDMVGAAAQALGSAAGDLLAKSVGSKLGIDDVGVSSNEALGGTSAFTVGKFLSPRLYLSYGVGLFEPGQVVTLRYRLSHRWNFEAQSATDFNRASLNYRLEK
ncbi:translocation/assembly module TamB domain-containing protein [Dyella sp. LX-66]|uniref:translocation/assembly module TamB domain-containing protein n=1 Tax=unclassified Dyella TaxID=2634549 RepID=UPI001BE0829D|nr:MULTISPECIES: translocation/assembly module TamB domain-containing protein [unclassified Dyella]MBT2116088.1 translocation/assembly module TamB domain-containing protein [Dyella sp. LX-1]MBT2138098.1 translocation/assembly module TamB domain-containing protein [Dyella sp. LX-66]